MWGHMGHMGDWGDWGLGWGWMAVGHLLWWSLLVVAIVALLRWTRGRGPRQPTAGADRALDTLRERFARGEIDREEFEERKRVLGG